MMPWMSAASIAFGRTWSAPKPAVCNRITSNRFFLEAFHCLGGNGQAA